MTDVGKRRFQFTTVGEHIARARAGEVTEWLVEGILVKGGSTLLYAPPGSGKSLVAMDLALAASEGRPWLGVHDIGRPIQVLYLDQDGNNANEFNGRLLGFGAKDDNPNLTCLMHQNFIITKDADRNELLDVCVNMGVKLLIIDSLTRIHDLCEKGEGDMKKVSAAIKEFCLQGITVVVLHHSTKSGGTYRGNNEIAAGCDAVFKLEKLSDDLFSMSNEKVRSVGTNGVWQGCQIVVGTDGFGNLTLDGSQSLEGSEKKTDQDNLRDGVLDVLRDGDQNPTTIQKRLKLSGRDLGAFNKTLEALTEDGLIESRKNPKGKGLVYSYCGCGLDDDQD